MKIYFNKNQGNALIMTIIVTLMFFIFAGSLLSMAMFSNNTNTNVYEREQARLVARSTVLSLKEYMESEGDKSFTTVGVPTSGGASNIDESIVSFDTENGSLGEANNIRVNVVDKSSSEWEVTIWATGHYPNIKSSTSGVDASVTFDMPKSSNKDGVLSEFSDNVLTAFNGDITFTGNNTVVGGVYAGGNITTQGSAFFARAPQSNGNDTKRPNYIRAGGNINIQDGDKNFDIDVIEAGRGIEIAHGTSHSGYWPPYLQNIGVTTPPASINLFHSTVFKAPLYFKTNGGGILPLFEGGNPTLMHTPETDITINPINIPLKLTEVPTLDLFQPSEILMNELPKGENVPIYNLNPDWSNGNQNQNKYVDDDVRLTGLLAWGATLTIDASKKDIIIYVDETIRIPEGTNIIINDGRDHTGENANSVVFIIGDTGELRFEGSGIRLNSISNTEIPQVYFISDSNRNILTTTSTSTIKGFVIAPNSKVTLAAQSGGHSITNFHGSIIANEISYGGNQLIVLGDPIESTMDKVTSLYVREVRGGSND